MLSEVDARERLVTYLRSDAAAHDAGRFDAIGRPFDSFEHRFPAATGGDVAELRLALTFWDAWIDARNHEWQTTAGIQPQQWPVLARAIADDLAAGRPVQDASVRARFDVERNAGLSERVQLLAARLRDRGVP